MDEAGSKGARPIQTVLIAVVFVVVAVGVFAYGWHLRRISSANVPGECTVVTSDIAYDQDAKYKPYSAEVTVAHELDGVSHRRTSAGPRYKDRNDALRELDAFKVGERVRCYYVDGRPDLVTVFPGKQTESSGPFVFGGLLLVAPVILFAIDLHKRRRR